MYDMSPHATKTLAIAKMPLLYFRRLKVFNQHASDEKLPTGDELETDALCGMEVYLQRFSRGISVSLSLQQTLLFVCLMLGERMTKPGYKYLIPCNKS